jgi:hypothetical protein
LLVKAFAIPELSIHPEARRFAITVAMPAGVLAEPKAPVTASVVDMSVPPAGGVTDVVVDVPPNNAVTPGGTSDTLRVTGELKPLGEPTGNELTGTVAGVPIVTGRMGPREKSLVAAPSFAVIVTEHKLLVPPPGSVMSVMFVRVPVFAAVSKSIRNAVSGPATNDGSVHLNVSWIRSVLPEGSCTGQMSKGL